MQRQTQASAGVRLLIKIPKLIPLPTVVGERGALTFAERATLGFDVARVYYLYNLPDAWRGGHAHKLCHELIVAVSGRFFIALEAQDGSKTDFQMCDPSLGLYVPPLNWRVLSKFSPGAVCLVLASESYREDEYLRNYDEFRSHQRV